jgi:PAS domain S-box-containing protein
MFVKQAAQLMALALLTVPGMTSFGADNTLLTNRTEVPRPVPSTSRNNSILRFRPDLIPTSEIASLTPQLARTRTNPLPVRIQGLVLDQGLGEYVTIQDDSGSIRAETRQTVPLGGGERVAAWGRLCWDGNRVFLQNAVIRPLTWDSMGEQTILPAPGKPDHLPTLTQVRQIRDLPPAQAAWRYPVQVRGVITTLWKESRSLFVQDDAAGIFVLASNLSFDTNWHVGAEVEIEGVSGPGGYAPIIEADAVSILGERKLPAPRLVGLYQMATGQFDAQWVEVRGVVRSAQVNWRSTDLRLSDVNGLVEVDVPGGDAFTNLVDSRVRVCGVCGSRPNPNRQLMGAYVWSPSTNLLVVEEKGVTDPFTLPTRPIASFSQFSQWRAIQHRVKTAGVVTFSQPGCPLFVQDETGGVPVYLAQAAEFQPGDRVEVAGYLSPGDFGYVFREARCRRIGRGKIPAPKPVSVVNLLNQSLHCIRVQLSARLVSSNSRANEEVLTLQTDNMIFEALRPLGAVTAGNPIPAVGSLVRLQGVYVILGDESRQPRALRIYIPPADPIHLVERPPWWNSRRASAVLGIMAAVVVAAALWAITLRRRVAEQTLVIRERLAKEAALEQRYREIFEAANDLIFTFDLDGRLTSLNPAGQRVLGYNAEEVKQLKIDEILAPSSRGLARQLIETQPANGTARTLECELVARDGRFILVETSARLILKDGKAHSGQAISRDITERKRAEEELFNSRQMLRLVLDTIPQRVFWKDLKSIYVGCNKSLAQDAGFADPDEIIGKTDYGMGWVATADLYRADDRRVMETGQPKLNYEEPQLKSDGTQTWLMTSKVPLHDKNGRVIGVLGTYEDITDRKRAEAALAEASALLQTLLEHSPDVIYFKDRQSRFVRFSKSFERLFQVSDLKLLIGKTDFDFFTEEHARPAYEDEQEIIRTGKPVIGKLEKETHQDGRVTWALTTKMPWRDKDGNIVGTFGISKEITAIKEAEAELAHERELFRALLDNFPDNIYFKDRESRFVRVSRAKAERTFDLVRNRYLANGAPGTPKELPPHLSSLEAFSSHLIGKTDFDTFDEEHAKIAFEEEQEIMRTGKPIIGKLEHIAYPGKWMLVTKMPWRDKNGNIIGTFGVSRDVTALKEAEAKLEAAHRRLIDTSRLAGMAEVATDVLHNVGNVLNSVNVSCSLTLDRLKASKVPSLSKAASLLQENRGRLMEFLTQDPRGQQIPEFLSALAEHLDNEQKDSLTELEQLVKHIDHIKQIVAMQQNYAKVAGVLETVNPIQLVEDALHINTAALMRHEVQVRREYEETPHIVTEKHKVLQILVNLIRNAKYAMDDAKGSDKVLTVKVAAEGNSQVKIQISDNGIGIARENLTRIFSHGFTTRSNGHGFGLHSGALAMRDLGGSLQAQSNGPGTGATFTLLLPLAPSNSAPTSL